MNDLLEYLKAPYVLGERHASPGELVDQMLSKMKEAADHIEAQNKLIEDLREQVLDYSHRIDSLYRKLMDIDRAEYLSKSNPNTPERNDE